MYARRHIYANGIVTQMYNRQPCAGYLNGRALVTSFIHTNFVDGNTCPSLPEKYNTYNINKIFTFTTFYNILSS